MRIGVVAGVGAVALLAAALGIRWLIEPPAPIVGAASDAASLPAVDAPQRRGPVVSEPVIQLTTTSERAAVELPTIPDVVDSRPLFDASSVGRSGLDEDEFEVVVARLQNDPEALRALVEQARGESDPERLAVLLLMLGDVDDPAVAALAAELIYSGDPASRQHGLDLLKRLRPGNPDVLAVVSDLLVSEGEPEVLVPTLTALARPGGPEDGARASLVEQVAVLSEHDDAAVRRTSIDILSRWSDDAVYTPRLMAGLNDTDENVQRAAAFAFVDRPSDDPQVHRALFALAEDESAARAARRGALLSLRSMPLEADQVVRIDTVSRELDRR